MRQLLSSHADTSPPAVYVNSKEYTENINRWVDEHRRTSDELWAAVAQVLSAAIQLDLETPSWCQCRPGGDALSKAIDTVLDALPPSGMAAFDKLQGA